MNACEYYMDGFNKKFPVIPVVASTAFVRTTWRDLE